jgi:DnaJ-class molecular chaperone
MIVPCACCGGDGVLVHEIGFDRTTGAVMEMIEHCADCDGTGCEWIEGEPLDEDDLEQCWPAQIERRV